MAYNVKDVFFLDASAVTTTGAGDFATNLDISSYVQPVVRKGTKPTGLAIYKVHWDVYDTATNDAVPIITTGAFRAGIFSDLGMPAGVVGAVTAAIDTFNVGNDLAVSIMDWWGAGSSTTVTGRAGMQTKTWLEPSTDVPYVIVRDTIQLAGSISTATSNACTIVVRLECAQITLDMATLNQLLRTQTV
jgi:hypothetical protein